ALAYCLDSIERSKKIKLTNYAEYLAKVEVTDIIELHENSSWSCVHGVERWRDNCGCNTGGRADWHQQWRKPLREALDWLRDQLTKIFSFEGSLILKDPWAARNEYIKVILDRRDEVIDSFLKVHSSVDSQSNHILRLLEMQRHSMLM